MRGLINYNQMKKGFRVVKILIVILSALFFVLSSIFTVIAIANTWDHTKWSYVLLGLFILDCVMYLLTYILRTMRDKPDFVRNSIGGINIGRKMLKIVYVIVSLIVTFVCYDNNVIPVVAKIAMTWFSLSMAVVYILMQVFILIVRKESKRVVSKLKGVKEEVYDRVVKVKNKRSN